MGKFFDNKFLTITISVALSALLWLYVGVQNPEKEAIYRDVEVKIVMQNAQIENGVTPIGTGGEKVTITLRGNANVLNNIKASDIYATLDVDASLAAGNHMLPVNVTLPVDNVDIVGRTPALFEVRLDKIVTAVIPVDVDMTSNLSAEQYTIKAPVIKPETIEIRGPETEVSLIKEARAKINITEKNMKESSFHVAYTLYDNSDEPITSEYVESAVRTIAIEPTILERKTLPVQVNMTNLPAGWLSTEFSYSLSPTTVELLVPVNEASNTTHYNAGSVDISKYEGNQEIKLPIDEMFATTDGANDITVQLKFGRLKNLDVLVETVIFDNISPGMEAKVTSTLPMLVQVRGKEEVIDAFNATGMKAVVDLQGITTAGTVELPVKIITGSSDIGVFGTLMATVEIQ